MATRKPSLTCPYCGEQFAPYYVALKKQTEHCTKRACIQAHKRKLESRPLSVDQEHQEKKEQQEAICLVCGRRYIKTAANRKTCGAINCQLAWGRKLNSDPYRKRKKESIAPKRFHICPICGKPHQHKLGRKTCGSQACVKAWKTIRERDRRKEVAKKKKTPQTQPPVERERVCLKCDKIFHSDDFRLCPTCRRENEGVIEW